MNPKMNLERGRWSFVQARLIWLEPATVSFKSNGDDGGSGNALVVVVLEMFDGAESPEVAEAVT